MNNMHRCVQWADCKVIVMFKHLWLASCNNVPVILVRLDTLTCVSPFVGCTGWRFTALREDLFLPMNNSHMDLIWPLYITRLMGSITKKSGIFSSFIYNKRGRSGWRAWCLSGHRKKWKRGQRWEEEKMSVEWRGRSWEQFLLMSSL